MKKKLSIILLSFINLTSICLPTTPKINPNEKKAELAQKCEMTLELARLFEKKTKLPNAQTLRHQLSNFFHPEADYSHFVSVTGIDEELGGQTVTGKDIHRKVGSSITFYINWTNKADKRNIPEQTERWNKIHKTRITALLFQNFPYEPKPKKQTPKAGDLDLKDPSDADENEDEVVPLDPNARGNAVESR